MRTKTQLSLRTSICSKSFLNIVIPKYSKSWLNIGTQTCNPRTWGEEVKDTLCYTKTSRLQKKTLSQKTKTTTTTTTRQ